MAFYTMIGFIVVAGIIGAGVYWVIQNITFNRLPERYTYQTDEAGNEYVNSNSNGDETDAKA